MLRMRLGLVAVVCAVAGVAVGGVAASGAAAKAKGLSGPPVRVGYSYFSGGAAGSNIEELYGAQAAAAYINSHGGIAGHRIQLDVCNDVDVAATAIECGHRFVDDHDVVVISGTPAFEADALPITNSAGILAIPRGNTPEGDGLAKTSYPIGDTDISSFYGDAKYFASQHYKRVSVLTVADPLVTTSLQKSLGKLVAENGVKSFKVVGASATSPDFTPSVLQVLQNHPQAVLLYFPPADCARVLQAAQGSGVLHQTKWVGIISCMETSVIQEAGSAANGLVSVSGYVGPDDHSNPQVAIYQAAMKHDGNTQYGWSSQSAFANVMMVRTLGDEIGPKNLTKSAFLHAMTTASKLPVFMGQTLSANTYIPGYPHLRAVKLTTLKIVNGKLVSEGGFYDAIKPTTK